jgi:tRNA-dihydrouridine synthase B
LAHLQAIYAFHGEESGLRIARKHLGWYAKLLESAPEARARLMAEVSTSSQFACANELFGAWAQEH